MVKRFEDAYPDIDIDASAHEADTYKTNIRVVIGSQRPPDIFFVWNHEWLWNFVRGGGRGRERHRVSE